MGKQLAYKCFSVGLSFCLVVLLSVNSLFAASAVLSWSPPATSNDGSPLNDLAGFNIYYGTSSGNYSQSIDVGNVVTYQVNNLTTGVIYYFATTAYDSSGNESGYSNEMSKTFQAPDTTSPVITGVQASNITSSSVTISWTTNEASDSRIEYGTSTSYGSATALNSSMVTSHSLNISGLAASTLYHYRVLSKDASGNQAVSVANTFTTQALPDTTSPAITGVQASNITSSSVTISWTTNEASDTRIEYGTSTSYGSATALNSSMVTSHSQNISGLAASTLYHYRVLSKDASGNQAVSVDYTFTTPAPPDTTSPVITGVQASNITSSSVTISWTTNEASDTRIEYGTSTSYGSATALNSSMVTSHSQNISGLAASTLYHYRVLSKDASGNQAVSVDNTFTTQAPPTPVNYYCDSDSDGHIDASIDGSCTGTGCVPSACRTIQGNDCNDNDPTVNPSAADNTCNGVDNNCDGATDNNYVIAAISCGTGVCSSTGQIVCQAGVEVNTCTPGAPAEASETTCSDGLDNDCDGVVDEGCSPDIKVSNVLLSEDFSSGIPATWSVQGPWSTNNPCGKAIGAPLTGQYAIVDSSCTSTDVDEAVTESINTVSCNSVALAYSNQYYWYSGNAEVDLSNDGGATWTNNNSIGTDDGYPVPNWKEVDISSVADVTEAKIKFKYSNGTTDGFWALDNVWVTCQTNQLSFSTQMLAASSKTMMISNTGTDNLSIGAINVGGPNASEFSIGVNDDCTNQTLLSDETCTFDVVFTPRTAGLKNANLAISSNDPDTSISNVPLTGTVTDIKSPVPVIKVNGSSGAVTVLDGENAIAAIELDPGSFNGVNGDWWVLMEYRNRWYYYDALTAKWRRGYSFYKQGQLENMGPVVVWNSARLSSGRYTLYFGVDTSMNGDQDANEYYFDSVIIDVK